MDFLRDWQFWGVVVSVLAIVSGFIIYQLQRSKKRLVYRILAETPLLSIDEELRGKIEIKYEKKKFQNIYLVILKIENIGNVDITSADYEQPIVISFPNSEIFSVETTEVSPKDLKPTVDNTATELTINPILLNKKDYFVCKLLFSKYEGKINVVTRIIGVKEVERISRSEYDTMSINKRRAITYILGTYSFVTGMDMLVDFFFTLDFGNITGMLIFFISGSFMFALNPDVAEFLKKYRSL